MGRTFPTVRQLWKSLAPETRARAAGELAALKGTPEWPPLDAEIARALNFRHGKIRSGLALDGYEQRLLDLLEGRANWDPAWSRAERDEAVIRLLEATGALDQAAAELTNLIHRTITAGDDAGDLLDRLRTLPHDPEQLENLERRLAALEEPDEAAEAETETPPPVRVLFVGGNETQEAYRDSLEQWLAESHPLCTVDFEFSGWTSNWGQIVDNLQSRLEKADVLILMRFTRTLLGRALRREADRHEIPWVACSGHGRDSLARSIEKAIGVARRRLGQDREVRA